jgi:CRP-like cAMP-binding protein
VNIQQELINAHIFTKLDSRQLDRVEQHAIRKTLHPGESLFNQGDIANRFYYVVKGQIKLFRTSPTGGEKIIEIVTAGDTFAEALMFNDVPTFPVGAQALTICELVSIDSKDFAKMLRDSTDTLFLMLGDLTLRLRGLLREVDELSQFSATSRVAAYLLRIIPQGKTSFALPVNKQILASRFSVTPETFSRIIKQLIQKNIIKVSGSQIEVLDINALEDTADACASPQDQLQETFHINNK